MAIQKASPSRKVGSSPKYDNLTKDFISTKDRVDRTSFSSIKESDSGIAQSFTSSKTSSYLRNEYFNNEEAIEDTSSSGSQTPEAEEGMLANPQTLFQPLICPCDGFKGWKGISLGGRIASKSFGDLKALSRWEWTPTRTDDNAVDMSDLDSGYSTGRSPLEKLPVELLKEIIDHLAIDIPPGGITARNIDLMSLLLTSRSMHAATLSTLYANITIPHSRIFAKFLTQITEHSSLGSIVRRLDFSHFNPRCAGMTARERAETRNVIPETILQCLELTPNLKEFLAIEHVEDDLDARVIEKLLCGLPKLKAIDFCACSREKFRNAFHHVIRESPLPSTLPITRLGLHECTILASEVYTTLLPKLPLLTHLDVAHTRITDSALHSLPKSARLTHLNLSRCSHLTGASVVDFLMHHPAARTLVYLNLGMDVKSNELFTSEEITDLLPILPKTLRSLNLKGSKMVASHIDLLLPLTKHLEELSVGRNLSLQDLERLFIPSESSPITGQVAWIPHHLRYLDVSDLSPAELDLGTLFSSSCPILQSQVWPLEVLEMSEDVKSRVTRAGATLKRVGWCVKELSRRYWLVRVKKETDSGWGDNGARGWKYGATYWGMRKAPVARAEVGGMYGHYMFKM